MEKHQQRIYLASSSAMPTGTTCFIEHNNRNSKNYKDLKAKDHVLDFFEPQFYGETRQTNRKHGDEMTTQTQETRDGEEGHSGRKKQQEEQRHIIHNSKTLTKNFPEDTSGPAQTLIKIL